MLIGVDVPLPDGYSGQMWKSNAPSVSNSHSSRASTSKSTVNNGDTIDYTAVDYSASSPRRSPRKHASVPSSSASSINASTTSTASTSTIANGKKTGAATLKGKKKPPPKRQRFAMSPDVSPVKEAANTAMFEEALDKAAESLERNAKEEEKDENASSSSEEILVTSPAKKRAKLEAEAEAQVNMPPSSSAESRDNEEEGDATMTLASTTKVEATTTTFQAAGETITTTTVKFERAVTPPHPFSSIIPSTPMSASAVLPIHIISPRTPQTPNGRAFSHQGAKDDDAEHSSRTERVHQRMIQHIGTFDKITIWNPDMELDKGDDCYVKSLNEWTKLADLVSFCLFRLFPCLCTWHGGGRLSCPVLHWLCRSTGVASGIQSYADGFVMYVSPRYLDSFMIPSKRIGQACLLGQNRPFLPGHQFLPSDTAGCEACRAILVSQIDLPMLAWESNRFIAKVVIQAMPSSVSALLHSHFDLLRAAAAVVMTVTGVLICCCGLYSSSMSRIGGTELPQFDRYLDSVLAEKSGL